MDDETDSSWANSTWNPDSPICKSWDAADKAESSEPDRGTSFLYGASGSILGPAMMGEGKFDLTSYMAGVDSNKEKSEGSGSFVLTTARGNGNGSRLFVGIKWRRKAAAVLVTLFTFAATALLINNKAVETRNLISDASRKLPSKLEKAPDIIKPMEDLYKSVSKFQVFANNHDLLAGKPIWDIIPFVTKNYDIYSGTTSYEIGPKKQDKVKTSSAYAWEMPSHDQMERNNQILKACSWAERDNKNNKYDGVFLVGVKLPEVKDGQKITLNDIKIIVDMKQLKGLAPSGNLAAKVGEDLDRARRIVENFCKKNGLELSSLQNSEQKSSTSKWLYLPLAIAAALAGGAMVFKAFKKSPKGAKNPFSLRKKTENKTAQAFETSHKKLTTTNGDEQLSDETKERATSGTMIKQATRRPGLRKRQTFPQRKIRNFRQQRKQNPR